MLKVQALQSNEKTVRSNGGVDGWYVPDQGPQCQKLSQVFVLS
jgi:hypothetical protein